MDEILSFIQIKGIRDGLLITLDGATWPELASAFVKNVDERSSFFQGARVALDVGANELRVAELSALRDQLSERGIALWAVLSESPVTETNRPEPWSGNPPFETSPYYRSGNRQKNCLKMRPNGSKVHSAPAVRCYLKEML